MKRTAANRVDSRFPCVAQFAFGKVGRGGPELADTGYSGKILQFGFSTAAKGDSFLSRLISNEEIPNAECSDLGGVVPGPLAPNGLAGGAAFRFARFG